MATTTISYTATYGSKTWTGSVTSPLTVSGAASRSITTTGTTTLSCAGKVCNSNIVIGGNTLACSGKMMSSNVVINATATTYYYWNRYSINATYNAVTTLLSEAASSYRHQKINFYYNNTVTYTNLALNTILRYGYATSYNLSPSTGRFSLSGGNLYTLNANRETQFLSESYSNYSVSTQSNSFYISNEFEGSDSTRIFKMSTYAHCPRDLGNIARGALISTWVDCFTSNRTAIFYRYFLSGYSGEDNGSFYARLHLITSQAQTSRGNYIDQVSSSNNLTYPTNGVYGNYWYTYVG